MISRKAVFGGGSLGLTPTPLKGLFFIPTSLLVLVTGSATLEQETVSASFWTGHLLRIVVRLLVD